MLRFNENYSHLTYSQRDGKNETEMSRKQKGTSGSLFHWHAEITLNILMKISEMTMRGSDLSVQAEKFATKYKNQWLNQGKHIADIEDFKVLQDGIHYSLWDNDMLVAVCSLSDDNTIDNVYVSSKYRGRKIFSMMIWFFKTRMNRSPLIIGPTHSKMMQEVVKGLSRFSKQWYNIETHEKEPFSLDTLENYYSYLQPTPWRLMLENSGDFSDWPMFNGAGFVKESYEPYVD